MVWPKFFVALHNDSVRQQSVHVARQMFLSHRTATLILGIKVEVNVFSVL